MDDKDILSTPQARGLRLSIARKMAGFTRGQLEEKYQISASTMQSWERAKAGGLTKKGAERVVEVLQKEGVSCTVEWLLYGVGKAAQPSFLPLSQTTTTQNVNCLPEDKIIIQELLLFRQLNRNTLDMKVEDDGMLPYFDVGDYVAGICYPLEALKELDGFNCIVRTKENDIFLRKVKFIKNNLCNLISVNFDCTLLQPTLYHQTLIQAAPVIWHRKNSLTLPAI